MKVNVMLTVAIMAFVMSCKVENVYASSLDTPMKEVFFLTEAGEKDIIIKCNKEFTPSSSASWCKVSKITKGIKATVTANETGQERTAIITITCDYCDNLSEQISVKQTGEKTCIFRIATYNILMDNTTWNSYRGTLINKLIRQYNFDIFGVQEAHDSPHLSGITGYDGTYAVYKGAGSLANNGLIRMYNSIVYNKSRFTLITSGDFWYSETPNTPSFGWGETEWMRMCSWAKFKDKDSNREFYVFNSHFSTVAGINRSESAKVLLSKVIQIAGTNSTVFVTGDFNAYHGAAMHTILKEGDILRDAYALSETPPTGTFATYSSGDKLDYIYVTKDVRVKEYGVINDRPNGQSPSDHDPVLTLVEF